jgi:hypothetical protein
VASHRLPDLALSRNSFQCEALARSMVLVHSLRLLRIFMRRCIVIGSSFPLPAQLSCYFLRALLIFTCCVFSSGVNHRLEYGHGRACGVCFLTAARVTSMRLFTVWSSWASDSIRGRGSIAAYIIFFPDLFPVRSLVGLAQLYLKPYLQLDVPFRVYFSMVRPVVVLVYVVFDHPFRGVC